LPPFSRIFWIRLARYGIENFALEKTSYALDCARFALDKASFALE
jgi:hypothetical protein